jgi:hypothetical protein
MPHEGSESEREKSMWKRISFKWSVFNKSRLQTHSRNEYEMKKKKKKPHDERTQEIVFG